jgi:transposase
MSKCEEIPSTSPSEIEALIERVKRNNLKEGDVQLLERLLRLLLSLTNLLQQKNASIKRLKRWLFGPSSDKRKSSSKSEQTNESEEETQSDSSDSSEQGETSEAGSKRDQGCEDGKKKRVGHGRLSASRYSGAEVVRVRNQDLKAGDSCPDQCCSGRLYDTNSPTVFIQLKGQPIVGATRFEQEVLRCSSCQERYTARLPEKVRPVKYLESADAAIVLAKHAAGLPFYRLEKLQSEFSVPLAESVQFERCERVADALFPVYLHLKKMAAQGEVVYADDTRVKILSLMKENHSLGADARRGLQTSALVVQSGEHQIALYVSGRSHARRECFGVVESKAGGFADTDTDV